MLKLTSILDCILVSCYAIENLVFLPNIHYLFIPEGCSCKKLSQEGILRVCLIPTITLSFSETKLTVSKAFSLKFPNLFLDIYNDWYWTMSQGTLYQCSLISSCQKMWQNPIQISLATLIPSCIQSVLNGQREQLTVFFLCSFEN